MSNLTDLAFPFIEPFGSVSPGFTKHEYAAILIGANLAGAFLGDVGISRMDHGDNILIADIAYNLAKEVLNKF